MAARRLLTFSIAAVAVLIGGGSWTRLSLHAQPVSALPPIERLVVEKSARRILAYGGGRVVYTIDHIQLGAAPVGKKQFQGDEKTPEGDYTIDYGNLHSAYHLSLHISYPDAADKAYAARAGRSAGGDIFIHGQPNELPSGRPSGDWTDGCIAVSNEQIETLWLAVPDGTPVHIQP